MAEEKGKENKVLTVFCFDSANRKPNNDPITIINQNRPKHSRQ